MERRHRQFRTGAMAPVVALVTAALMAAPAVAFGQESGPAPSEAESGEEEPKADQPAEDESGGEGSTPEGSAGTDADGDPQSADSTGPTPKLALLPNVTATDDVSSIVPERIGELLRDRLEGEASVDLLPPYAETYASGGGNSAAVIQDARESYRSGNGLANSGDFEKAAKPLSNAVETFRNNMARLQKFSVYTDALLKLAWSYWKIDHNYDARKSMREFAHLEPEAELDAEKYPEKLLEVYRSEVEKIEEAGTGTLVIDSEPSGATVWIDGERRGNAPVTANDVGFGYHYAVVEGSNGARKAKQLRVRGDGRKQKFTLKLEGGAKAQEGGGDEKPELPAFYTQLTGSLDGGDFERSQLTPYLEELSNRTEADYVTWIVLLKGDMEYTAAPFVYRIEDDRLVRADDVTFSLQLSNLRIGVRKLAGTIVENVEAMPESKTVESVSLGTPEKPAVSEKSTAGASAGTEGPTETAQATPGDGTESGAADPGAEESGSTETDSKEASVDPPPSPKSSSDGGNNTLTYIGIGGAAAAVGGLIAGGILLSNGNQQQSGGFSASVSW